MISTQTVNVNSTLCDGEVACAYSNITFTCVTRGSNSLSWNSEDYIGPGNAELGFSTLSNEGATSVSSTFPMTVATLIQVFDDGQAIVLVSTLDIVVTSASPSLKSITCQHNDDGLTNTTSFYVIGINATNYTYYIPQLVQVMTRLSILIAVINELISTCNAIILLQCYSIILLQCYYIYT